jgi:hypothetical protein
MPSFEHEPLVLFLKPNTSYEEENKGNTNGVGQSSTRVAKEPRDLIRGKDSPKKEATEHTLK